MCLLQPGSAESGVRNGVFTRFQQHLELLPCGLYYERFACFSNLGYKCLLFVRPLIVSK